MINSSSHSFHIPVMGLAFSIDAPIKVAHYGIDSVISIVDDDLIEKMRKIHSNRCNFPYEAITTKENDYRAKRITAYLNLVSDIVHNNFTGLKKSFGESNGEFEKYINLLPDNSELKLRYNEAVESNTVNDIKDWMLSSLKLGSIDVNIMTKVDKSNYDKNEKLPVIYNDAHAALRGFANSKLNSSIVLSAGMNPRLYSYFEEFEDFFPNENGVLNKKIMLKVSDYRSALIQGKFLAKKGLWVSEYRIESGLNCGGHAFATDGFLMGPILEEFRLNRNSLIQITHEIYTEALRIKNRATNSVPFELKITAQGGVGTFEEHNFLLEHYQLDSIGWGTPFLLVPEVTNVDEETLSLLINATEDDLYLSKISPLGVPFNSVKGSTKDLEKLELAVNGKPGSPCPKKFLQFNTEFGDKPICTASRSFQSKKIKELEAQPIDNDEFVDSYNKIIDKACLCVGLATAVLKNYDAAEKSDGEGVLICPGPNLAYFSKIMSLIELSDHIYGRANVITRIDRPHMFIKELNLYIDYLQNKIKESGFTITEKDEKYFLGFGENLKQGINYYYELFNGLGEIFSITKSKIFSSLKLSEELLDLLMIEIQDKSSMNVVQLKRAIG